MHAAGIVAEHSADRAMIVRRRIGSKNQAMLLDRLLHFVEHDSRLDAHQLFLRIDLDDAVHVFREIDDDRDVAALARQARAAAATGDRRADISGRPRPWRYIAPIARNHDTDRDLPVIRAVGRIKCAVAVVETNFAANRCAQFLFQADTLDV